MKAAAFAMCLMVGLFAFGKEWEGAIAFSLLACQFAYYAGRLDQSAAKGNKP